jgi:hypothetical protein
MTLDDILSRLQALADPNAAALRELRNDAVQRRFRKKKT